MKFPMKGTALALSTLLGAMVSAHAQSNVSIYGILDASVSYAKATQSKTALRSGDLLAQRLGFRGSEDLGSGLKASFMLEAGISVDNGTGSATNTNNQASGGTAAGALTFNRQSWVGLEGEWGALRLGRTFNPTYRQYIDFDPFGGGGLGASQAAQSSLATYGYNPWAVGLRHSNAVEYSLPAKGALTGQFMYAMGENASNASTTINGIPTDISSDGNYLAGRLAYKFGQAQIGFAAGQMKNAAKKNVDEYVLGGKYALGDVVLMGMYSHSKEGIGTKQNGWLVGGTLRRNAMAYSLSLSGSQTKKLSGASIGKSQKMAALARYHLSKRSSVYLLGVYTRNSDGANQVPLFALTSADTAPNQNARAISVGLTHVF